MTDSSGLNLGAFTSHSRSRDVTLAGPPRLVGEKSHLYQPPAPRTPPGSASSSTILSRSVVSIPSVSNPANHSTARKRTLHDYSDGRDDGGRDENWVPGSPKPFVNTRYQLAGGMDTPTLAATRVHDNDIGGSEYSGVGYRKSLADEGPTQMFSFRDHELQEPIFCGLDREANGRGRGNPTNEATNGWSKGAARVVGAVVGKAWEFCKIGATVFTGFRAGGGTSYKVHDIDSMAQFEAVENENNWEVEKQDWRGEEKTSVPGQFPEEGLEFIPDYMDNPDQVLTRPSKRRQISNTYANEDLAKNWVVVSNQLTPAPATPTKPQARGLSGFAAPTASSAIRRSGTSIARPASRAGLGINRPARSLLSRGGSQVSQVSHAGSPALQPNRGASFASSRSPASSPKSRIPRLSQSPMRDTMSPSRANEQSPAAKEAKKWKAVKRKEEREADESIRRLDAQLKAMIREGKEALGTKIEVELDDDEDFMATKRWAF